MPTEGNAAKINAKPTIYGVEARLEPGEPILALGLDELRRLLAVIFPGLGREEPVRSRESVLVELEALADSAPQHEDRAPFRGNHGEQAARQEDEVGDRPHAGEVMLADGVVGESVCPDGVLEDPSLNRE